MGAAAAAAAAAAAGKGEPLGSGGRRASSLRSQSGLAEHQKQPTDSIQFLVAFHVPLAKRKFADGTVWDTAK